MNKELEKLMFNSKSIYNRFEVQRTSVESNGRKTG